MTRCVGLGLRLWWCVGVGVSLWCLGWLETKVLWGQSLPASGHPQSKTAQLLYRGVVSDVVVGRGSIAILEASHRVLAVRDAKTGGLRWSKAFQKRPIGVHSLHTAGSQVVVYGGARLFSFAMATGKQSGRRGVRLHWHLQYQNGCTFVYRHGACGLSCGDEFQLLHCETMYPMSAAYALTRTCFSGSCFSFRGQVVGVFPPLWLAEVEEPKRSSTEGEARRKRTVVAIHQKTGVVAWESNAIAVLLWHPEESGFSPDLKTCWLANYTGETRVFDCQKGTLLWSMPALSTRSHGSLMHRRIRWYGRRSGHASGRTADHAGGLVVWERLHISWRNARTGQILWQRHLPEPTVARVEGGIGPRIVYSAMQPTQHWVLSARNGSILRKTVIPSGAKLWGDVDGTWVLNRGKTLLWKYRGVRKQLTLPWVVVDVVSSDSTWIVVGQQRLWMVAKQNGAVLLDLAGEWRVFAAESSLGKGRMLLRQKQTNGLWDVRLFAWFVR